MVKIRFRDSETTGLSQINYRFENEFEKEMKKKMKMILLFCLTPMLITAQIDGIVKDSVTGKPIPYVAIRTLKNMYGVSAAKDGSFTIPQTERSETFEFSVSGYQPKKISNISEQNTVLLSRANPQQRTNPQLKKQNKNVTGEIPVEYDQTQTSSFFSKPAILAKYFPSLSRYDETPYVNAVMVYVLSKVQGATYKIRIFEADENGAPAKDLLDQDIIAHAELGEKPARIDISGFGIKMPANGIVIGVESIITAENMAEISWKTDNNDPESAVQKEVYQPTFRGNSIRKGALWRFYNNKWSLLENREKRKTTKGTYYPMNNLYLEIELTD